MDANTIFVKTAKAGRIGMLWGGGLTSQSKRILSLVDGRLSVEQLLQLSEKLSKNELQKILLELEKDGYIHRMAQHETEPAWLHDVNNYSIAVEEIDAADLNFSDTAFSPVTTSKTKNPTPQPVVQPTAEQSHAAVESTAKSTAENTATDEIAVKAKREAERKAKVEAAEKVRREAEVHAKRIAEAEARARQEMERIAREKAEAVAKAHAEELARQKAETERKTQAEAEARAHAAAEQKARLQAERISREQAQAIAKAQEAARLEAERKAKVEAEERARAEAELKAQAEAAEQARLAAEMRAREEAEARARIEAERQAQEALAEKARQEAEEKARLEAERMARELAEAKAKAESEEQARQEAERKAQQAAEQAGLEAERIAREQAETQARLEAERQAQEALAEKARQETEEKTRLEAERMARELADAKAKAEAEEQARLEVERRALEAAEQARLEAERIAREQAETLAKVEAERQAQEALAEKALQEAEEKARLESELMARELAEAKAKAGAEEQARLEVESRKTKADLEEQTRINEERKALAVAAEQAMQRVENLTRADVEAVHEEIKRATEQASEVQLKPEAAARATHIAELLSVPAFGHFMRKPWLAKTMKVLPFAIPLALVLIVALVHVMNLGMLVKPIETVASDSVGEPVKVREVHAALFPQPRLVLTDVSVGSAADIKIGKVSIAADISLLFDEVKHVQSIELNTLTLNPAELDRQMQWVNHAAKADKLEIGQIILKNLSFNLPGFALDPIDGTLVRSTEGVLTSVELTNHERNLSLVLTPQSGGCALALNASLWKPPLLNPLELDEISATGVVSQGQASFSQIEAKAYGGTIRAQGVLNWSENLSTSGNFELVKVTLPRLLAAFGSGASVDGMLNAKAAFAANAFEASALMQGLEVNARFEVLNGKVNNVALSHAVMAGAAAKAQRGSDFTRFDTLTGSLQFKDGRYAYRQLALKTEQFQARGNLDIEQNKMVSGKINAELTSKTIRKQASFNVDGELANLKLH